MLEVVAKDEAMLKSIGDAVIATDASARVTLMNPVAEALGLSLPGCAMIPAPYRERGQIAYETGKRIVAMVHEDLRPSAVMTRESFLNAIVVNPYMTVDYENIGGSGNCACS